MPAGSFAEPTTVGWEKTAPKSVGYYVTSYSRHVVHSWRLQPQNEMCQMIQADMSSGEITGEHFQSGIFGTKVWHFL